MIWIKNIGKFFMLYLAVSVCSLDGTGIFDRTE